MSVNRYATPAFIGEKLPAPKVGPLRPSVVPGYYLMI